MVVKRTFTTQLEPPEAFAKANELLRPRGFDLEKGNHDRAKKWRRGLEPGKKSRNLFKAPQEVDVEFDRGRVNVTATCAVSGRSMVHAQRLMTAYAESVEKLLSVGVTPKEAAKGPKRAEANIRSALFRRSLSLCTILVGILAGAGYIFTHPKDFPLPAKLFSSSSGTGGQAAAKPSTKAGKSAPVITVRKAGVEAK